MGRRRIPMIVAMLLLGLWARGDDKAEQLLRTYLKAGVQPNAERFHPDYPSEREALIGVAERLPGLFTPDHPESRVYAHVRDGLMDKPIVVRVFSSDRTEYRKLYTVFVPIVHPTAGLCYGMTYGRSYSFQKRAFKVGFQGAIEFGRPEKPAYLIRAEEAKQIVESRFGKGISREALAVSLYVSNWPVGAASIGNLFWYVRYDRGVEWNGRTIHSLFVYPFASVKDPSAVSLEELSRDSSVERVIVLLRHRMYTWETEEVDLYALDAAQRAAGDAPFSTDSRSPLYLPEPRRLEPVPSEKPVEP